VAGMDLDNLPALIETYVRQKPAVHLPADLRPARYYALDGTIRGGGASAPASTTTWDRDAAKAAGESLIRRGKVAAFVVAGGQGSRLGYEGPKGCYPAGAVTGKPLFALFAEALRATNARYAVTVPWYVMTSPLNHDATVSFFRQHNSFGLDPTSIMFFQQGVMPSLDMATGTMLMTSPWEVATNPDGHGGSVRALYVSGALADMQRRGVEQVCYFQVDNPLVRVIDPVFLGLHVGAGGASESSAQMSSKMVAKAGSDEKVGVFCLADGKTQVLEYSDMPRELATKVDSAGNLAFNAGSIAIHILSAEFLVRLATDPQFTLPCHRAEKKIPCIDAAGTPLTPASNNGVKLEKFIFDALAMCKSSIVLEVDRSEEFAPIKNAAGVDSVETSKALQSARAARWLEAAGHAVPRTPSGALDCTLELSALTALEPADLRGKHFTIPRGSATAL
jgi:UDP-N-acetylglucosamine/UDP-N-acetylgalactosamine diphosphorylase